MGAVPRLREVRTMSEEYEETVGCAICPDCGEKEIVVETAPRKPPRLACRNCRWTAIPPSVKA
jgi:predicted RNA-binding Zn-ribbon protein involved in translation (DUF1610 family)